MPRKAAHVAGSPTDERLIGIRAVCQQCGNVSRQMIWRLMRDQGFPKPAHVGARNLWSEREVSAWIAQRLAARAP